MKLIFGGAYQGKLDYVKENYSLTQKDVFVCNKDEPKLDFTKKVIYRLEDFVLACLKEDKEAKEYLQDNRETLQDKIIVCNDISQGIVPMNKEQRALREMTGRAMVYLGKEADSAIRIFCGLAQKVK
ncbi:MAG: bifunctional adenosylcobinamide kinase/adenosylcobinamide-phosphate guanylyltransferase [Anaerovoracaceae bacterium]